MITTGPNIAPRWASGARYIFFLISMLWFTGLSAAAEAHAEAGVTSAVSTAPNAAALFALLALPFIMAAATPLLYRFARESMAYLAAGTAGVCFLLVIMLYGTKGAVTVQWIPAMDIALQFYVDGLSILIGMLASGIGLLILLYSKGYMHGEGSQIKYYASLLTFMGSMLGVAFAANLIALFVFWELTSISSFLLIGHYQRKNASQYAARKSMLITVGGGIFMLAGFVLIHTVTGTYSLVELLADPAGAQLMLRDAGLYLPVLLLVAMGAATKSAQVPFHIWLPNAMEAPTPVSAFLHSATMVKAGVYLVGRFRPILGSEEWMLLFVTLGLATMTFAGMRAVAATDIKELLAYSTASHLGLIMAGFGFVSVFGGETGAFHILNHAVFKAALFMVAGIIAHEAGTRIISDLGGLRHHLPWTAVIAVITGLGMAGLPPFNGFYSKELLFEAAYEAAAHSGGIYWLLPVAAVFGSIFTFIYSLKFIGLFFGDTPQGLGEVHSPPWQMLAPPLILATVAAVISISPQTAIAAIVDAVNTSVALGEVHHMSVQFPTHLTPAFTMSLVTIGFGVVGYRYYQRIHDGVWSVMTSAPYLTPNWWYDGLLAAATPVSVRLVGVVHNGMIRSYATATLAAFAAITVAGYMAANVALPPVTTIVTPVPIILVLSVALVGAFAVMIAPSHVSGVLTLSILGFMVAIYYILARAPDLALTQLVAETLALIVFLLVLDKLPEFYAEEHTSQIIRDVFLAVVVGGTVMVTVLLATAASPDTIAHFFVERALPDGGGGNIVNVILVDFRGFDTMGEISVVAMAALSVVTLIAMRGRGRSHRPATDEDTEQGEIQ